MAGKGSIRIVVLVVPHVGGGGGGGGVVVALTGRNNGSACWYNEQSQAAPSVDVEMFALDMVKLPRSPGSGSDVARGPSLSTSHTSSCMHDAPPRHVTLAYSQLCHGINRQTLCYPQRRAASHALLRLPVRP